MAELFIILYGIFLLLFMALLGAAAALWTVLWLFGPLLRKMGLR